MGTAGSAKTLGVTLENCEQCALWLSRKQCATMELVQMSRQALGYLLHGHIPPRELSSLLISKVRTEYNSPACPPRLRE